MNKKKRLGATILALAAVTLACSFNIGGPDIPDATIPISAEAVEELNQHVQQALVNGAQSGVITLNITETQMTSYLAARLQSNNEALITEPQVHLRDGLILIYGKARQGYLEANIGITLAVTTTSEGKPAIEVVEADFGPLPVAQGLKSAIAGIITEAYTGPLGPVATGFRLDQITIANGIMTVTGRIK